MCEGFNHRFFGGIIYLVIHKKAVQFAANEAGYFLLLKNKIEHFIQFPLPFFSFTPFYDLVIIKSTKLFIAFIVAAGIENTMYIGQRFVLDAKTGEYSCSGFYIGFGIMRAG